MLIIILYFSLVVASVSAVATEIVASPSAFLFKKPPEEDFFDRFNLLMTLIEEFSARSDHLSGTLLLLFDESFVLAYVCIFVIKLFCSGLREGLQ